MVIITLKIILNDKVGSGFSNCASRRHGASFQFSKGVAQK